MIGRPPHRSVVGLSSRTGAVARLGAQRRAMSFITVLATALVAVVGRSDAAVAADGGPINDVSSTRTVQLIAAGLAVSGIALGMITAWWWRSTKPHHEALGPLDVMSRRRWMRRSPNQQQRELDEARPDGAGLAPAAAPVPVDLSALAAQRSLPGIADGGGFADLADLSVPAHAPADTGLHPTVEAGPHPTLFNGADHTDWNARPSPTPQRGLAAELVEEAGRANGSLAALVRSAPSPEGAPAMTAPSPAVVPPPPPRPHSQQSPPPPPRISTDRPPQPPSPSPAVRAVSLVAPPIHAQPPKLSTGGSPTVPSGALGAPSMELPIVPAAPLASDPLVSPPQRLSGLPFRPFRRQYGEDEAATHGEPGVALSEVVGGEIDPPTG